MPNYGLGLLITLNITLTLAGILLCFACAWAVIQLSSRSTRELSDSIREGIREIAQIQREVAFMIRRQYGDIDRDLQEIKEMLGGG